MKFYTLLLTTLLFSIANSQIIFFEDFQGEANNSTSGVDSTGVSWATSAPFASTGFFRVRNNKLVAKYTRGQATFETDTIGVPCLDDVLVTLDLRENGQLETSGCIADYTKFEYSWDNGATWDAIGDPVYGTTNNDILTYGCANEVDTIRGPFLTLGDFPVHQVALCIPVNGTTLKLRLIVKTYWTDEKNIIDNFRVECSDCDASLPVELLYFNAKPKNDQYAQLNWATATEINNDGFEILRSTDGVDFEFIGWVSGNGNQTSIHEYSYEDYSIEKGITYYYQLKQIDYDGQFEFFNIESIKLNGINTEEYTEVLYVKYYSYLGEEFNVKPNLKDYIKCTYYVEGVVSEKIRQN